MNAIGLMRETMKVAQAINNRSYHGFAPATDASAPEEFPFIILSFPPSNGPEYQTDGILVQETIPIYIRTFHTTLAECASAVHTIEVAFSHLNITAAEGRIYDSFIAAVQIFPDPDRNEKGEEVWTGFLKVDLVTERSLS